MRRYILPCIALVSLPTSDFAIEDFRKLKRWMQDGAVLDLWENPKYKAPIIRRSVMRFALQCPTPRAVAFVDEQRLRDPEYIAELKELLDLES